MGMWCLISTVPFFLPQKNKVKLSRLGGGRVVLWFVFLRFQPSGGRRFFPCV